MMTEAQRELAHYCQYLPDGSRRRVGNGQIQCGGERVFMPDATPATSQPKPEPPIMSKTTHSIRRLARLVPFASALFVLAGCASITPIGELLDNSSRYDGKTVRIAGEVKGAAGVLVLSAYQVSDGTGTLTVVNEGGSAPPTGARVGVKGTFQKLFNLGFKSLAVLREQSRFRP